MPRPTSPAAPASPPRRGAGQRLLRRAPRDGAGPARAAARHLRPGPVHHRPAPPGSRAARGAAGRGPCPAAPRHLRGVSRVRRRDRGRAAGPPRHRRGERRRQGGQLLHRPRRRADADRRGPVRPGRHPREEGRQRRHHAEGGEDHPRAAADPRRSARGAARPGFRPPVAGAPGEAARRLLDLHPLLRADQPHRHHHHDRPEDRRGAGDAPPPEPCSLR